MMMEEYIDNMQLSLKKEKNEFNNKRHYEAFLLYCEYTNEGKKDVFQKVADELGVMKGTVYNWSSKFKWKDRYKRILLDAIDKTREGLVVEIEKNITEIMFFLLKENQNIIYGKDSVLEYHDKREALIGNYKILKEFIEGREEDVTPETKVIIEPSKETLDTIKKIDEEINFTLNKKAGDEDYEILK